MLWTRTSHAAHHRLSLPIVLEGCSSIAHDWRNMHRGPVGLVKPHFGHVGTVGQHFSRVLLVLGVLNQSLVLPSATLADTAECKDRNNQKEHAGHNADDDVFRGLGETVPFLFDGLRSGRGVFTVKLDWCGIAVTMVSMLAQSRKEEGRYT